MELLLWFLSDLSPLAFQHSKGVGDVLTVFTATCSPHSVALKILPMFPPPRDRKSLSSSAHTERQRKECRCVANANISGEAARRLASGALVAASREMPASSFVAPCHSAMAIFSMHSSMLSAELDFDAAAGQNLVLSSCRDKTRRIFGDLRPLRSAVPAPLESLGRIGESGGPAPAAVTLGAAGPPGDKRECSAPMGRSQCQSGGFTVTADSAEFVG